MALTTPCYTPESEDIELVRYSGITRSKSSVAFGKGYGYARLIYIGREKALARLYPLKCLKQCALYEDTSLEFYLTTTTSVTSGHIHT